MNLAAIVKARTLGFIEIDELNTSGRVRLADIVPEIAKRYDFKIFPTKIEDFDLNDKGVVFASGRLGGIVIDELKIYSGLIYVESLSTTEDSHKILIDLLEWGAENLGLTYTDGMIRHWAYVSHISFNTDFPLIKALSSPLDKIAEKTGKKVSELFGEEIVYHPMNFVVGHDPRTRKYGIAPFSIQQRAGIKFDDNKFFSEAPLPTELHIEYLREIEKAAQDEWHKSR
ncbi:hypothetical protein [Granulicella sp. S156]|uniref:hypothetical protein n=1 Tax=Granulicella sp. S156 TaxID=1747224 RepID=UPI00131BA31E|nr:hypothetical protein [Granulicella sp. S156]